MRADGSFIKANGSFMKANGSSMRVNGSFMKADGSFMRVNGSFMKANGGSMRADGSSVNADGSLSRMLSKVCNMVAGSTKYFLESRISRVILIDIALILFYFCPLFINRHNKKCL